MNKIEWISEIPSKGDLIIYKGWYGLNLGIFVRSSGYRVYYIPFSQTYIGQISFGYSRGDRIVKYDPHLLSPALREAYNGAVKKLNIQK